MARAELIEERDEAQDQDQGKQTDEGQTSTYPVPEEQIEDDLPDKYKGKSLKEVVAMHQSAEKLIGRQGTDLGEMRKAVEKLVMQQNQNTQEAPKDETEEVDFFVDPKKSVERSISSNPEVQEIKQELAKTRQERALGQLKSAHPDYEAVMTDPQFADWIRSSTVRAELLTRADQQYDVAAANELLSTWKQLKQNSTQVAQADKASRATAAKKASTGSAKPSTERAGKKKYRQRDIINLINNDPAKYEALQPEIMAAYAEGRVIRN